jgi:hypothetical protein
LVFAGGEALAWCLTHDGHDAYRNSGRSGGQGRGLDGEGQQLGNNDNDATLKLFEVDLDRCAERMIAIPNPFARLAYWLETLLQEGRQT